MTYLERIFDYSTYDLQQLQEAILAEIDRRKSLTAASAPDEIVPRLAIVPESEPNGPATAPRRRAA